MLLGCGGPGQSTGSDLTSGAAIGAVGCLSDAADQQRVNRAVVTQVKGMSMPVHASVLRRMPTTQSCT